MSGQNFADRAAARRESQKGFTLIEMSIVLVIIGLIVGGVLKGQEVINGARVKTQVAQIDAVKSAVYNFQDKFNFQPGDFTASAGLVTSTNKAFDGDENGVIGTNGSATAISDTAPIGNEMGFVWYQLAVANLMPGVNTNVTAGPVSLQGKLSQAFLWYGTFQVATAGTIANPTATVTGNFVRIDGSSTGLAVTTASTSSVVRNIDALAIDTRYDDGNPTTGSILASINANCWANQVYLPGTTQNCDLLWGGITQ